MRFSNKFIIFLDLVVTLRNAELYAKQAHSSNRSVREIVCLFNFPCTAVNTKEQAKIKILAHNISDAFFPSVQLLIIFYLIYFHKYWDFFSLTHSHVSPYYYLTKRALEGKKIFLMHVLRKKKQ